MTSRENDLLCYFLTVLGNATSNIVVLVLLFELGGFPDYFSVASWDLKITIQLRKQDPSSSNQKKTIHVWLSTFAMQIYERKRFCNHHACTDVYHHLHSIV